MIVCWREARKELKLEAQAVALRRVQSESDEGHVPMVRL